MSWNPVHTRVLLLGLHLGLLVGTAGCGPAAPSKNKADFAAGGLVTGRLERPRPVHSTGDGICTLPRKFENNEQRCRALESGEVDARYCTAEARIRALRDWCSGRRTEAGGPAPVSPKSIRCEGKIVHEQSGESRAELISRVIQWSGRGRGRYSLARLKAKPEAELYLETRVSSETGNPQLRIVNFNPESRRIISTFGPLGANPVVLKEEESAASRELRVTCSEEVASKPAPAIQSSEAYVALKCLGTIDSRGFEKILRWNRKDPMQIDLPLTQNADRKGVWIEVRPGESDLLPGVVELRAEGLEPGLSFSSVGEVGSYASLYYSGGGSGHDLKVHCFSAERDGKEQTPMTESDGQ